MQQTGHIESTGKQTPSKMLLLIQVGIATFSRLLLNTARRFPYTFSLVLSRGIGVPLTAIAGLIAVNQITGVLAVFFGPIGDHLGYRPIMSAGLIMLISGMLVGGVFPYYSVIILSLFLAGLGKGVFDPALQAYVGSRVPFRNRGTVIGILEISWAGSTLVGIPMIGYLMDRYGWRSPFFALAGLGLMALIFLHVSLKAGEGQKAPANIQQYQLLKTWKDIIKAWKGLVKYRAALGAIGFAFFFSAGNDSLFVVYGAWLETSFHLSVLALGVGTSVIGVAEFAGEMITAGIADRIGLKRSVIIGLLGSIVSYALLPFMGSTLYFSLAGLFFVFVCVEFTVVSTLSLCTELVPGTRATMMSTFFASAGLGRILGALLGGPVWLSGGILATSSGAALISVMGLWCMIWGLKGWEP